MTLETTGEFQALYDLSPEEYYGCVYTLNENRRIGLGEIFADAPLDLGADVLIVSGSDGKSERHTQSKTEMTILTTNVEPDPSAKMAAWYKNTFGHDIDDHFEVAPTGIPEVKLVGERSGESAPLAYAYGDRELVYPDRVLNSQVLVGNEAILTNAKRQVLQESVGDDDVGKRIRKAMETQLRITMKGLTTGVYRNVPIFSLDPPQQHYNEDPQNYSVGFKVAGLRPVQRMADLATIRAIRANKLSIDDATTFPTNTVGRIEALSERGLVPDPSRIIPAYEWFLQQYHVAQDRYKSTRSSVVVQFRADKFLSHRSSIVDFRESMKKGT